MDKLIAFRRFCIDGETKVEGGWVKDPKDLGGETNHGITHGLAKEYKTKLTELFNWDGTMRGLTKDMAYWIYEQEFWHGMKLDAIYEYSETLCHTMFRWGLKSGSSRPVRKLQDILNVLNDSQRLYPNIEDDGIMGGETTRAIDGLIKARGRDDAIAALVSILNCCQVAYMIDISKARAAEKNERFTWGWSIRCLREMAVYITKYGLPKL